MVPRAELRAGSLAVGGSWGCICHVQFSLSANGAPTESGKECSYLSYFFLSHSVLSLFFSFLFFPYPFFLSVSPFLSLFSIPPHSPFREAQGLDRNGESGLQSSTVVGPGPSASSPRYGGTPLGLLSRA